jgi:hypothetical protein
MSNISQARMDLLRDAAGRCNYDIHEFYVSAEDTPFTYGDVAAIQDRFYGGRGETQVHMSDIPGQICWKSRGNLENRKFADSVDQTCVTSVLNNSENGEAKCNALYTTADHYAADTGMDTALKIGGGLLGVWAVFGPGMSLWKAIASRGGKSGGPQNPTGGSPTSTGSGSTPAEESNSSTAVETSSSALEMVGTAVLLVGATILACFMAPLFPAGATTGFSATTPYGSEPFGGEYGRGDVI